MGTLEAKKQEKRQALLDAAYVLFLERGASKTSVSDITSRARVAKGTFYLYFQDKDAVLAALLGRISYRILDEACVAAERECEGQTFTNKMLRVIDYIIEYMRRETLVLRLIQRNFIWPELEQIEASGEYAPLVQKLLAVIHESPEMAGRSEREIYRRLSALVSMCTSVCYSSILENKPDTIDNMKPVLYDIIRKAL
jgi:AcrR family transcriptional regulator